MTHPADFRKNLIYTKSFDFYVDFLLIYTHYIFIHEIEVNSKVDSTRKQFAKYLVEIKKAKGKFSFFPD